ncbi:MAG: divalent metal cation transporter, partial [Ktedonobacterales bacterium]|nr:divalent metal cation transporter [Ktedonobacterales bacterium]
LIALMPGLPLIQLIIIAQVINGMLLPILLVFILRLVNDRRIMGAYINGRVQNIIAGGTAVLLSLLSAVMIASVVLPSLGIPFLR